MKNNWTFSEPRKTAELICNFFEGHSWRFRLLILHTNGKQRENNINSPSCPFVHIFSSSHKFKPTTKIFLCQLHHLCPGKRILFLTVSCSSTTAMMHGGLSDYEHRIGMPAVCCAQKQTLRAWCSTKKRMLCSDLQILNTATWQTVHRKKLVWPCSCSFACCKMFAKILLRLQFRCLSQPQYLRLWFHGKTLDRKQLGMNCETWWMGRRWRNQYWFTAAWNQVNRSYRSADWRFSMWQNLPSSNASVVLCWSQINDCVLIVAIK